jgi:hypothetical protein
MRFGFTNYRKNRGLECVGVLLKKIYAPTGKEEDG